MLRAAGCENRTKSSPIDSAHTEDKQTGWNGVDDGQCNWNKAELGSEGKVGQNVTMCHQVLYVSWPRVLDRDIFLANSAQYLVNIG